jgi:hypothetical protein
MSRKSIVPFGLVLAFVIGGIAVSMSCRDTNARWDGSIPDGDADSDTDGDADRPDWDGSPLDPCGQTACGDTELCGSAGRGDGLDNDCDGQVDEDCTCQPMTDSMSCFPAPPDRRNVGACSDGVQTCSEFGTWNSCVGAVVPVDEVCDGMDNDCDGSTDEDLRGCDSAIECPGGRGAAPLSSFRLNGSEIYSGPYSSWHWSIECPPTVPASSCPQPTDPNVQNTEVYFIASGTYRVRVTIVTTSGETFECSFAVFVQGTGLRVELNWDSQGEGRGDTDVDLHLHQNGTNGDFFTGEDCYFANCTADDFSWGGGVDWGLPPTTDTSACAEAPHGNGATWVELGYCNNPRLDVDVINCNPAITDATDYSFCAPENINIDTPPEGQAFRVMVNYYSAHGFSGITHPSVNIYCGGELRASFGVRGEVELRNGTDYGEMNDNWMVADVRFRGVDECGRLTCEVEPLNSVIQGPDFGPPWSW